MSDIRYIDKNFVTFNFTDSQRNQQKPTITFAGKVALLEERFKEIFSGKARCYP
jgi:hypothetical protein